MGAKVTAARQEGRIRQDRADECGLSKGAYAPGIARALGTSPLRWRFTEILYVVSQFIF